jgi:tRNA A-37 threonylcarbamoyl transferase component Bud32
MKQMKWLLDVSVGMKFLHEQEIIHGNLTTTNILVRFFIFFFLLLSLFLFIAAFVLFFFSFNK